MPGLYKNILVAVDESESSERAFQKAIKIAKHNEAESFTVTHVIEMRAYTTYYNYNEEMPRQYANEMLDNYVKKAEELGMTNVKKVVEIGSPKVAVAKEVAPKVGADLIVCGATGVSAVDRLFIGSVSENIARYAKCDVLIVRNDDN